MGELVRYGEPLPKSTLTVLNEEYFQLTGQRYFLFRSWSVAKRQWRYTFRGGVYRVTYVGALLAMRAALETARTVAHRRSDV